jgi:large subunit ribosomal protein L6
MASRIAKQPVDIVKGVTVEIKGRKVGVKGPKGNLSLDVNSEVEVKQEDAEIVVSSLSASRFANAIAGTTRALIQNMMTGVSTGFERKLELVGVGYRAQAQGNRLNLTSVFRIRSSTRCRKALPSKRRARPKSSSKVSIGRRSGRLRRSCVNLDRPSPTRAKVSAMPTSGSY